MARPIVAARSRLSGARLPVTPRASVGLVALLVLVSAALRARGLPSAFWIDEGLTVGISSFPLLEIPSMLALDGSPPLYYLLLHVWMAVLGDAEAATNALSLVFALATIPVGLWAGWSLFGPRTGWFVAAMFALNPFISTYSHETRMYSLVLLLGLVATTAFVHAFVLDHRRYAILFAGALTLMLYTHNWSLFFAVAAALSALALARSRRERRWVIARDAALAFGAAGLLFVPWLPTLVFQVRHTGAPWSIIPGPADLGGGLSAVVGGWGAALGLLLVAGAGVSHVLANRRSPQRLELLTIAGLGLGTLLVAWVVSQVSPAWAYRYLAVLAGPVMVFAGVGLANAQRLGVATLALIAIMWLPQGVPADPPTNERNVVADVEPYLDRGDVVVSTHPERLSVLHYYLPAGLTYATSLGEPGDPRFMDWRDVHDRLRAARASKTIGPTLDTLATGSDLLLVRPVTQNNASWRAPWTALVRRRSLQWARFLREDPRFVRRAVAPDELGEAETGVRATLYTKVRD